MRNYELVFIVHPSVDEDGLTSVIDRIKSLIDRVGGNVVSVDQWGVRRLAYPIQDQWEGQYVLTQLELDPQQVSELEHDLGLIEPVMRHLIVRLEEEQAEGEEESA